MLPAISPAVISHLAMPNSGVRRHAAALRSLVSAGARDRLARAEEPVVRRLCAGGKWIRTIGSLPRLSSIRAVRAEIIGRSTDVFRRDREFDVSALQGRLSTSSQSQCSIDPGLIAGTWHARPARRTPTVSDG